MDELKNFLTQVGTRSHSSLFVRRGIQQEGAFRLDVRIRPLPDLLLLVKRQDHRFRSALHPDPGFDGPDYLDRCPGAS